MRPRRGSKFGVGLVLTMIGIVAAQEQTAQIDDQDVSRWVNGADIIVIGTFRSSWPLPWIDGWHYTSRIDVWEQLAPQETTQSVELPWVRAFGANCLICNDWRPFEGKSGIWFLRKHDDALRIFGGTTGGCASPLDLRYLNAVKDKVRVRSHSNK